MALNITPEASDTLAQTQLDIKNNFIFINTGFAFDHVEFNVTGAGKHNKITFPVQSPAPVFVDAGDLGLFSLLNNVGNFATNRNELNVYKANNATYVNVPFTASVLSNSSPVQDAAGWSYLPSGLIIQWGSFVTGFSTGTTSQNFPIAFPTAALSLQLTLKDYGSTPAINDYFFNAKILTNATFRVNVKKDSAPPLVTEFYYFAIGY